MLKGNTLSTKLYKFCGLSYFPVLIIALGLVARLALYYLLTNTPGGARIGDDYIDFGRQLADSKWVYDDPVRSPLTTLIASLFCALSSVHAEQIMIGYQLLMSCLMIASIYLITTQVLSYGVAIITMVLLAFDPLLVMYSVTISSEATYLPLASIALYFLIRLIHKDAGNKSRFSCLLLLDLLLVACQYTRPSGVVYLMGILVGAAIAKVLTIKDGILIALCFGILCAPWVVRNGLKYGYYQFTSSSDYNIAALYIGGARIRLEPLLAKETGAGANINIWRDELGGGMS